MKKFTADYIFPINQPPVKNGIIITDDNGTILENVITPEHLDYTITDVKYNKGFICPGFVNAHCHLELSYLKNKISEYKGLEKFIIELEQIRNKTTTIEIAEAICKAEAEMYNNGIVAVCDISNNDITFDIKNSSNIYYHTFIECFASSPDKAEKVFEKGLSLFDKISRNKKNNSASLTPHATYSLSKKLFSLINDFAIKTANILSIHHQESEEENKFFLSKHDGFKTLHNLFGIEYSDFYNIGLRPLAAIAGYIPKNNLLQLVHNTVSTNIDIDFANASFEKLYWCICPNANLFIERKLPDIALLYNKKCKITVGTDSLASNRSLSVLDEIRTICADVPFITLNEVLKWATFNGAQLMQIEKVYGSIEKGKAPGILLLENVNAEKLKLTNNTKISIIK